jgi:nicotinate-nucleotide pyrophosphorylase (carboxylating)
VESRASDPYRQPTAATVAGIVDRALREDIGPADITTDTLVDPEARGDGAILAKQACVVAGLEVARQVFARLDPHIHWRPRVRDGDSVTDGTILLEVGGRLRALLSAERTALNFLQRLSGIATRVRSYADRLASTGVRLVDTRKTSPGLRLLEKYAVRVGGGFNHRSGLFDGVLIKDNHIAACGGIQTAVDRMRRHLPHLLKIEIEVTDLDEVRQALDAGADVIMLDNMTPARIAEAVKLIDGRASVEVSGGVTETNLLTLAAVGVDIVSVGALTHSAASVELSMQIRRA